MVWRGADWCGEVMRVTVWQAKVWQSRCGELWLSVARNGWARSATVTINLDSVMASSGLESCGNARSFMVRQSRRCKAGSVMERLGLFGQGSRGKEQLKGRKGKETK